MAYPERVIYNQSHLDYITHIYEDTPIYTVGRLAAYGAFPRLGPWILRVKPSSSEADM